MILNSLASENLKIFFLNRQIMSINLIHYYNNSRIRAFGFVLMYCCCYHPYAVSLIIRVDCLLVAFFFSFLIWEHFTYFIFCDVIEQPCILCDQILNCFVLVQRVQQNGAKTCNLQNKTPTNRHVVLMCIIPGRNTVFCVNKKSMNTQIILL